MSIVIAKRVSPIMEYAEAFGKWNPEQPRDTHGRWAMEDEGDEYELVKGHERQHIEGGQGRQIHYTINHMGQKVADLIGHIGMPGRPKDQFHIDWIGDHKDSLLDNDLGPTVIRSLINQFKAFHPEIKSIAGWRVSGARAKLPRSDPRYSEETVLHLKSELWDYLKYRPDQPRDERGRWTSGALSVAPQVDKPKRKKKEPKYTLEKPEHTLRAFYEDSQGNKLIGYNIKRNGIKVGDLDATIGHPHPEGQLYIDWIGQLGKANTLGPKAIRQLLNQLRQEFPEIKSIAGFRISGARRSFGGRSAEAEVHLKHLLAMRNSMQIQVPGTVREQVKKAQAKYANDLDNYAPQIIDLSNALASKDTFNTAELPILAQCTKEAQEDGDEDVFELFGGEATIKWAAEQGENDDEAEPFETTAKVLKVDTQLGIVFGWAMVCKQNGVDYWDTQHDNIPESSMLEAAADFMANSRVLGEQHERSEGGQVLFAFPLTQDIAKAFGIQTTTNGLMIGVKPANEETLRKFADGTYTGFSIGGRRHLDTIMDD